MIRQTDANTADDADARSRVAGFMDIGTNSMRLLVARIESSGAYAVLTQQKESIRLGEGEFAAHQIQPEAMERAVLVGTRFAEMARSFGAEKIFPLATSAAREASNKAELIARLRASADVEVRVISGHEEARLIYLGVISDARLDGTSALVIDIGGGSTELIVGDEQGHQFLDSLRLGAIRLTNQFFKPGFRGAVGRRHYARLQKFIRTRIARSVQRLQKRSFETLIGSSGTIVTLGEIAARRFLGRAREKQDRFAHAQLSALIEELARMPLEKRQRVPGMSANRADLIVAGAAILDGLLGELGGPALTISERTLRDGLLIDHLQRHTPGGAGPVGSFRLHSVLSLGRQCRFDEAHARHVARLAAELFDSGRAAGLHDLGGWERELLEYAALLHDAGTFLTYTNHRAHSYYFIRNAELLGFDETEIGIIATTALFHKKTYPRKRHAEFMMLDRRSRRTVRTLCMFLRIAESLDRSHAGPVAHARFGGAAAAGPIRLELESEADCHLELWSMEAHLRTFERTFARPLVVAAPAGVTAPLDG